MMRGCDELKQMSEGVIASYPDIHLKGLRKTVRKCSQVS
jgi:hypothetical protein